MKSRGESLGALIIGYGNPLRGDDAAGHRAVEILSAMSDPGNGTRFVAVHQLTPELAETVAGADDVYFIDAAEASKERHPGTVRCEAIQAIPPGGEALGHHMTPQQLLAFTAALYGARPRAFVYTIAAESFDYGAPLSRAVVSAMPSLVRRLRDRMMGGPSSADV
ncbi:MAG TPA: hydrogenase maturation protease [Chthoniobacteraceae bacterium]|jgi:hydrogenase maturation protease|nr:hydrogenase maturation protease [Chthoniobacteraceae bacterium]